MAKLLQKPHLSSIQLRSFPTVLSNHSFLTSVPPSLSSHCRFSLYHSFSAPRPRPIANPWRDFSVRAFDSSSETKNGEQVLKEEEEEPPCSPNAGPEDSNGGVRFPDGDYPSGEFEFRDIGVWKRFVVKLRMLFAFPWERVRKGSVLTMNLRGQISDQLKSRFSSGLSLPQICENFIKAAYDPRVSGIYLHIEPLNCGWGKVEELRRHILNFRKSGKFIIGYVPACGEKEYYLACACEELYAPPSVYFALYGLTVQASFLGGVLEKVGIEPIIQRIGKYKSAGDQLARKTMSEENCEMLTALLDNIYGNWLEKVSLAKGKSREDVERFVNEGVYQVERLKEEGWITDIQYDDEVISMLKGRLGLQKDKKLPLVDYRKYSRVRKWTLGLLGGKDQIAIIRASGSISRVRGPFSAPGSGIIGEQLIEKIRTVRESKRYKAAIIRIDSPGGDALASDLMWREIRLLSASMPVIASMSDVAASGGYYMAMAAGSVVAENLTLTGSIGVVTGKFNLGKLYERIGFNKEIISRGKYAELNAADQRSLRPDEAELFANSAQNAYKQFRDKAAFSRSMTVEKMEENAQGRVWTGGDASLRGLVDAIGGFSRAVAIAKQKANIPQGKEVTLVELSRPSPTLPELLSGIGSSMVGVDSAMKGLLQSLTFSDGVQARMDGILFQRFEGESHDNPVFALIKEYLVAPTGREIVCSESTEGPKMASSSPPQTPPSASISQNSSTRPISPTPPKPEPDAATRDCVPDVLDRKPDVADTFQGLDSVDYLEKYKKYEADCVRRLQAKYFSKNNIYGGHIFDEKMTIDNETIKSSRWPCTRSYADPVKAFEDLNRSGVSSTAETSCNISNESSVLMKTS